MIDQETYIRDGLKIIDKLMDQGDLKTALGTCHELLKIDPYNQKTKSYLEKIEKIILRDNIRKVDKDIDSTMHLWKEGRLNDLSQIYAQLYQYAPHYERLLGLIQKLKEKYTDEQKTDRNNAVFVAIAKIEEAINSEKFADAILQSNELIQADPLNESAKKLLKKAQEKQVEKMINENESIIEGADSARAVEFLESLLGIDPKNGHVKTLLARAQENVSEQKKLADQIHLNEAVERIKELFGSSEYEKVLQSCEEVLRMDPGNFTAKIFRQKCLNTIDDESDSEMLKKMHEGNAVLGQEYAKNPGAYIQV